MSRGGCSGERECSQGVRHRCASGGPGHGWEGGIGYLEMQMDSDSDLQHCRAQTKIVLFSKIVSFCVCLGVTCSVLVLGVLVMGIGFDF